MNCPITMELYNLYLIVGILITIIAVNVSEADRICAQCKLMTNPSYPGVIDDTISGTIQLQYDEHSDETEISLSASGIPSAAIAEGGNGFHIHTENDMSDGCNSLGGHYNPMGFNHSGPDSVERHVGDLGNIDIHSDGSVEWEATDSHVKLSGEHSVMSRSFVLHVGTDDLGLGGDEGSLATGNAGSRLACCIIEPVTCSARDLQASLALAVLISLMLKLC